MAGNARSGNSADTPWPAEIRVFKAAGRLEVDFADGGKFVYPAELLRVESPSAEVQGHGAHKTIVAGRRYVKIAGIEEVGNYAIRILFDDGHDTGIYSWAYLHDLGQRQDQVWSDYLKALAQRGLSRDP
ncbi:MAG: gamma-butyrobetaine hydroxylase-like domain-containing protein [Reyranellaceae bacterium]